MNLYKAFKTGHENHFASREFETEELFLAYMEDKSVKWRGSLTDYKVMEKDATPSQEARSDSFEMVETSPDTYEKELHIPGEWSYTSEDITAALDNEATVKSFEEAMDGSAAIVCENVMKYITQLNADKSMSTAQKDAMMADSDVSAILTMLMVAKRPSKSKGLIVAYSSETYYTTAEKQVIIDYITAKGF